MQLESIERSIKVIVVGNGAVGKSSLVRRFADGLYSPQYKETIGTQYREKKFFVKSKKNYVTYNLWDTAGQEKYSSLTRRYYRGAGAALLVYSTTDIDSFKAISKWYEKVVNECGKIYMILIENKVDLIDKSVVNSDQGESLARKLGVKIFRICVKNNFGVDKVFKEVAENYFDYMGNMKLDPFMDIDDFNDDIEDVEDLESDIEEDMSDLEEFDDDEISFENVGDKEGGKRKEKEGEYSSVVEIIDKKDIQKKREKKDEELELKKKKRKERKELQRKKREEKERKEKKTKKRFGKNGKRKKIFSNYYSESDDEEDDQEKEKEYSITSLSGDIQPEIVKDEIDKKENNLFLDNSKPLKRRTEGKKRIHEQACKYV